MPKVNARFTPRFGKRFSSGLEEGHVSIEGGYNGKVKIMVQNSKGNQFWIFVDPVDLLDAALGAIPLGRLKDVESLEAFKRLMGGGQ